MGARRKIDPQAVRPAPVAPAPAARLATADAIPAPSPVHAHIKDIEARLGAEPQVRPYPLGVRLAIMVGGPAVLWASLIAAVGAVAHAVGA